MANPLPCDMGCGTLAYFLVGNVETGDQTAFCIADFARAGLESAKATLPREEVLAALGIAEPATAAGAPAGTAAPKAPKSAKGKAAKSGPKPPPPAAVAEGPPAPSDGGD